MLKRVIEGFKYMFGGEIELPENVQKAIKNVLDETIGTAEIYKKEYHDALAIGRFSNYITTYLSEQHWPKCHTDYIGRVGRDHHKTLVNIRRKGKSEDDLYHQIYDNRSNSRDAHSGN